MSETKLQKPFLKWVGGKTQIMKNVIDKMPKEMNNYHEPFLGGGSVLLAVLSLQKQNEIVISGRICAYDLNGSLINVYKDVQNNKDELFLHISKDIEEYDSIVNIKGDNKVSTIEKAKTSKESYYYWIRSIFNSMDKNSVEHSAIFMFLNKTCFRGMYREGPNGFNIPFGHYKKTPTIITKEYLDSISDLIQNVEFIQSDFNNSINNAEIGDYVYLDPPYAPENDKSFVGYTKDGFGLEAHKSLFNAITILDQKNIRFAMSNAKVKLVMDHFKDYKHENIVARRAINSKNPGSTAKEVIIYN